MLADLKEVANKLIGLLGDVRVCVLSGEMGSGKTTLVKTFGNALQVTDSMNSPTFSLINEYNTLSGNKIYHFDLYRLKSEREAFDIGVEDYLYSGAYCFVEWPEKMMAMLPPRYAEIKIDVLDQTHRKIECIIHG
ncbi:MAG: tRNA (adenosine(37)-N6)-threonylcarbamoyltransferase complex ATPase subunit type 1 TsaE [Cyclobacteriaceae bacterium]|nr:tRNA (adenosine(37)-N6)-threonylcarbamoyltransferase complex ATPase subunit type 1 TsaE [Cyclobacteriaceae bacterium]